MTPISPKIRLLLFLYSTQNLIGCVLAIGGLALFFFGLIKDWWLPIVAGLYAVGWLAVPTDKALELQVRNEATQANLIASIEDLIQVSKSRLPTEALEQLKNIREIVKTLSPKLFDGSVALTNAVSLVNAVTRDLPETVRNYLLLPPAFANMHPVDQGKTCKQLLLEQLDLLSVQLAKIAENIYKDDADALVVNGRFLQEKFHALSFVDRMPNSGIN